VSCCLTKTDFSSQSCAKTAAPDALITELLHENQTARLHTNAYQSVGRAGQTTMDDPETRLATYVAATAFGVREICVGEGCSDSNSRLRQ